MGTLSEVAMLAWELVLLIVLGLALLAVGIGRLSTSRGIHRDGLRVGSMAPRLTLVDRSSLEWRIPSGSHWLVLLFMDHSLRTFPDVLRDIPQFQATTTQARLLLLTKGRPELIEKVLEMYGVDVPVVPVSDRVYNGFRVRVMPFAAVVDPHGHVAGMVLANGRDSLRNLWLQATNPRSEHAHDHHTSAAHHA